MKRALALISLLVVGGCAGRGYAEDYTWSIEVPATVERGVDFRMTVLATGQDGTPKSVKYRYAITWTAGSSNPLRHKGATGSPETIRARTAAGPATLMVFCENKQGIEAKVLEKTFEVK